MTQIEDRLRDALATAPRPASATTDPLGDLERRVTRTRRRRRTVAVAVAVVTAATVVPLSLSGGASKPPASHARLTKLFGHVSAVASGGGYVWTLRPDLSRRTHGAPGGTVSQRKPGTLQVVHRYRIPEGPAESIAYGLGRLWIYGGGSAPFLSSRLSVINLADGHRTTRRLGSGSIDGLVFQSGRAWMLSAPRERVIPLEVSGDGMRFGRAIAAPNATALAAGNGLVYALAAPRVPSGPEDTIAIVDAPSGRSAVTQRPIGHIVLVLPGGYLVVGNHRLVSEGDSRLAIGPILPGQVGHAVATTDPAAGTAYVVTDSGNCGFLTYPCQQELEYSVTGLARGTKHPIATTLSQPHGKVVSLAADPSGSLLISNGRSLYRWIPSH